MLPKDSERGLLWLFEGTLEAIAPSVEGLQRRAPHLMMARFESG